MNFDIQAAIAQAAAQAPDMNEAQKGGTYTPPAEGPCILTLVGYIEKGIQHKAASKVDPKKYPAKDVDCVDLIFELSGKNHEPTERDGKFIPHRIRVELTKSLNEKAWYYKLFKVMNYDRTATHFAQLLGKHFVGRVVHSKSGDRVYANLKDANGYTIQPPTYHPADPETGEPDITVTKIRAKPPVHTDLKLFLWDFPSKEMWASLYIEGKYDDRKDEKTGVITPGGSKNVIQESIRKAVNFKGSPLEALLGAEAFDDAAAAISTQAPVASGPEQAPVQPTGDDEAAAALADL